MPIISAIYFNLPRRKIRWDGDAKSELAAAKIGHIEKIPASGFTLVGSCSPHAKFDLSDMDGSLPRFQPKKYGTLATISSMSPRQIWVAVAYSGVSL